MTRDDRGTMDADEIADQITSAGFATIEDALPPGLLARLDGGCSDSAANIHCTRSTRSSVLDELTRHLLSSSAKGPAEALWPINPAATTVAPAISARAARDSRAARVIADARLKARSILKSRFG